MIIVRVIVVWLNHCAVTSIWSFSVITVRFGLQYCLIVTHFQFMHHYKLTGKKILKSCQCLIKKCYPRKRQIQWKINNFTVLFFFLSFFCSSLSVQNISIILSIDSSLHLFIPPSNKDVIHNTVVVFVGV